MSNVPPVLPDDVSVSRSDPVYMAHGYLTKVPIAAIEPYIAAFTEPGDVVLDPFAGSGMTGVAATALGRAARLADVSVLGRHIGTNYVNLVDPDELGVAAGRVVEAVRDDLNDPYATRCSKCAGPAETVKVVMSAMVECAACATANSYYAALERADWRKASMRCSGCDALISTKSRKVGERAEIESVSCQCSRTQIDQPCAFDERDWLALDIEVPSVDIESDRQMYIASALGKHKMTSTRSFFSDRNAVVLASLHRQIESVQDPAIRSKLLFAFTAVLPRASKRYQWSKARPLNAANSNYYVAPVFYEWNCFDLFTRKVAAVSKSDAYVLSERRRHGAELPVDVEYTIASATNLPYEDNSIDYVFTDPPFGWNIFYSDMNLFQEAWLGSTTSDQDEAVIDRSATARPARTAERYEAMLVAALEECQRVLKPGGWITLVFGNSSGSVWEVVQRAIISGGLTIDRRTVASLNKGQRSVKGLASGFENVVTHDLIVSLRPVTEQDSVDMHPPTPDEVALAVERCLPSSESPSHLYVSLLKEGIGSGWALGSIDLKVVTKTLLSLGYETDPKTGRFVRDATAR